MKKPRRKNRQQEPALDISSLIDVSFLLLIFFLVTSTLQKSEAALNSKIPGDETTNTVADPPYEIDIALAADGAISVDGEVLELADGPRKVSNLRKRLKEIRKLTDLTSTPHVAVIVADDEARHQRLVDVFNVLVAEGITSISMEGFGVPAR